MPFLAFYIEQTQATRGLYKPLGSPGTKAEAQTALNTESLSNGDSDPSHYRVIEFGIIHAPASKAGGFVV